MKERVNMAESRTSLQEKESPFLTRDIESKQRALEAGSGQKEFEQPELVINKDGSVSYAEKPKTTATQKAVQGIEEKQQLKEARQEYFSDKSNYLKTIKNSYSRGEIDNKEFQTAVAAIKVDDKEIKRSDEFINDVNYSRKKLTESQDFQEKYINDVTEKLKSGEITQEQYDAEYQPKIAEMNDSVEKQKEQLNIDNKSMNGSLKAIERSVAENRLVQEQIGSTGGAIAYNAIKMATDLGRLAGLTPEDQEAFIRDNFGIVTTEEFIGSEDRTFLQQAAMSSASTGVAIAAGLVGGAPLALASLWAAGTFEMFDDEELKDVPKRDKFLMSAAYGVVSSYLEKIGLDELVGGEIGKKLAMNVVKDAAKKLTKDAPKEYVENLLISETKSRLQQAGVKIGVGMLAEGTTEALQSLANVSTKEVYDQLKGTEYFNNKTGWEIASDVLYDGALGAVGGGMISSVVTGAQQTVEGRRANKMDAEIKALIAAAETEGMSEAVKTTLKAKIIRGEITKADAINILGDFDIIKSKVDQMPNTLTEEGKAASLDLMLEKDKLEKQIEGKDPNLVEPQKKRVNEINDRLKQIGKDAVQKQTTSEVPIQSEAGVGQEVEGRVSEPTVEQTAQEVVGEEIVGEEAQGEQAQAEITQQEEIIVNPSQGYSFTYASKEDIPNELKGVEAINESTTTIGKSKSYKLTFSGQQLIDAGLGKQEGVVPTETAPSTEAELDFEVTPEVTQEADALEKLLADEGITVELPMVEETVSETVTAPEETIVDTSEVSDRDVMEIEDNTENIKTEQDNIKEYQDEAKAKVDKINNSKWSPVRKKNEIAKVRQEYKDKIEDARITIATNKSDLKKAETRVRKATKTVPAPVVETPIAEAAPVAEAKPTAKPKAVKKLTQKETIQKYNDHIDSLIKDEKERSDRRIAQIANQRNLATGQRRTELTQEIQDLEFAFRAKKRGLDSKKDDKQAAIDFNEQGNINPIDILFQLDSDKETTDKKKELLDIATAMMEEAEKEGFSEEAFTGEQPEPQVELITIDIKENTELANKVKRMGLSELIGKKINLVMADQLKVDKGLMGGPFFPLINKLFGKVAWASINDTAAIKIINGAIKSDYTVVYNMNPEAIDSNVAVLDSFERKIQELPKKMQQQVFIELTEYLNEKKFGEKTDDIRKMASESNNLNEFLTKLNELDVDTIAAVVKSVLPSKTVKAGTKIGATLQSQNISIEDIREENIEQFVAGLPAGALTMVLQVTDKNGNKVTKQTAREALMSRDQQKAEGLPIHKNYPVYIRGKAVGILKETTPFWNVFKDSLNEINVKVAGVVKHSTGRKITSKEAVSNEMRSASMTASQARKVSEPTVDMYKKFVSVLSRSIPGVNVVTSQKEFNDLLENLNTQKLSTKNQKVYGAVYKGKIYLNPSLQNYNTPIHEFGHIWLNVTKTANQELYNKGIDLVKDSEYVDQIRNNKDYQRVVNEMLKNGSTQEEVDNYIYEEALATAIGDKGESFVKASQALKDFKSWLDKLYSFVRKITGISKYTAEQLQDISLDEFLQAVSVDLLSGEKLFDVTEESMSDALQLMSKSENISKIVDIAAKNGVSNEAVKTLLARKGFSISDINAAFVKKAAPIKKGKVSKVTVNEKTALKDQIRFEARAAREAKKDLNDKRKDLAKTISDMETTGKITTKQAQALMARISKINMDNPAKVDAFVEYAGRVFENAEFAQDVARANALKSKVKNNAKTKLGIANDLISEILKMASINPSLIPSKVFDTYLETMEMLGQRTTVLKLEDRGELTQKVSDILDAVNEELSVAGEMSERFEAYDKKEVDSEGKIDFAKTLSKMVADGTITEEDADIMRKYKSEIIDKESTKMTEEELETEKKSLISILKKDVITDEAIKDLPSRLERDDAKSLKELINTDAVKSLNNTTLKNLLKLVDNVNNGFFPHFGKVMQRRLNSINNAPTLKSSVKNANPLRVSSALSKIKSLFVKKRNYVLDMERSISLANIDQVFGDFKTENISETMFDPSRKAHAAFESTFRVIQDKLEKARQDVFISLGKSPNKAIMSDFKTMTYLLQLEKESNPDSKQVNNAVDFINATISQINDESSNYTEKDAKFLQEILDEYTNKKALVKEYGKPYEKFTAVEKSSIELDNKKLYNSFNASEKASIKAIQEANESMTEKAVYTSGIIRGDKIDPIANYVPHVVLAEVRPGEKISGASDVDSFNKSRKPSTKANNLVKRTGTVTAISFDPYQSTLNATKNVLLDFYMTDPIITARMTINETRKKLEEEGITKEQNLFLNAIRDAFEEATKNVLVNSFQQDEILSKVARVITKAGYRSLLGTSTVRTASELLSNMSAVALMEGKAFLKGASKEFRKYSNPEEGIDIMINSGATQIKRVMGGNTQGSMFIDPAIMNSVVGMKDGKAKSKLENTMQMIYNRSLKNPVNWIEATSDVMMSAPDILVTRPTWFGAFANEFEKVSGNKVDFDKIKANDEAYMNDNKDAIEAARKRADKAVFKLSATNNPYMGVLKNNISPDISGIAKTIKIFDNYLNTFTMYEYTNARTAIYALAGQGMISKKEAILLLAGVTTRMITYSLLLKVLGSSLLGLFMGDDDEDDDKTFMQKLGQAAASAGTTMMLGRNFGNIARNVMGYGAEQFNKNYLTALREGDYDAYEDAIQYTVLPQEKKQDMGQGVELFDIYQNMLGPAGPFVKSLDYSLKKLTEKDRVAPKESDSDAVKAKRREAVLRQQRERNIRVPLELTGTLGYVPFYKDIRKVVNEMIYTDLKKSLKEQEANKEKKAEMLMGYESKADMELQNPKLYEKLYDKGGKYYAQEEVRLANENLKNNIKKIQDREKYGDISPMYARNLKKAEERKARTRIKRANR